MILPSLRRASASDIRAIQDLQLSSLKGVAAAYYTAGQIETFASFTSNEVESLLASAKTWVVEDSGLLVACASWLPDQSGLARIRSVYVRAGWTRRGLANRVVDRVENEAASAGFTRADLLAMRGSERFYASRGYSFGAAGAVDVDGMPFPGHWMSKALEKASAAVRAA